MASSTQITRPASRAGLTELTRSPSASTFKTSITTVLSIAPADARGETLAGLFVAAYLGLTVPVVGLGIATQLVTTKAAILGFAAVLIAAVAVVSRRRGAST
jgi:hypothetical protein